MIRQSALFPHPGYAEAEKRLLENDMGIPSLEICAGAGGQALGLERAGFEPICLVEIEAAACNTLKLNRHRWEVIEEDVRQFSARSFKGIDLLAGGVPCPPFSKAGKQLGDADERNLFPEAIRLADECRPRAIMLENVRGLLDACFEDYRVAIVKDLKKLGYIAQFRLLNASDFGVPQLRPRVVLIALKSEDVDFFKWPDVGRIKPPTVGEALYDLMSSRGWRRARVWKSTAHTIAPTLVGGSKKHGGPDLGPTRAKKAWANLGVDGNGLADYPPDEDFEGMPRLTVRMTARLQGFEDEWHFSGGKTAAYRQIGNAFPPPVAHAVGRRLKAAFAAVAKRRGRRA